MEQLRNGDSAAELDGLAELSAWRARLVPTAILGIASVCKVEGLKKVAEAVGMGKIGLIEGLRTDVYIFN